MRLFRPGTLNGIFLIPIATYASRSGGRATTQEAQPGPLAKQQVEETAASNTMALLEGSPKNL